VLAGEKPDGIKDMSFKNCPHHRWFVRGVLRQNNNSRLMASKFV
jgi:hypothetical protein